MRTSDAINDLAKAMALAQAEMKPALKDSTNPAFKSKYADLTAVWDAIRVPLSKHSIAVWQDAELNDAGVAVTTRLAHISGQWVEFGPLTVPCLKRDAFGVGSATSYARRYALSAAVGVVSDDDDDGVGAVAGQKARQSTPVLEVKAPAATGPVLIPEGAVTLKKVEQHETKAKKPYWLLILAGGEELITWGEQSAAYAEQACQDGAPVRLQVRGTYDGKAVVQSLLRASVPSSDLEPSVAEIFNKDVPPAQRGF